MFTFLAKFMAWEHSSSLSTSLVNHKNRNKRAVQFFLVAMGLDLLFVQPLPL